LWGGTFQIIARGNTQSDGISTVNIHINSTPWGKLLNNRDEVSQSKTDYINGNQTLGKTASGLGIVIKNWNKHFSSVQNYEELL
jgi:hypothetical protein